MEKQTSSLTEKGTRHRKSDKKNPFCLFDNKASMEEIFEKNPKAEEALVELLFDKNQKVGLKAHSLLVEGFDKTSYETRLAMLKFVKKTNFIGKESD